MYIAHGEDTIDLFDHLLAKNKQQRVSPPGYRGLSGLCVPGPAFAMASQRFGEKPRSNSPASSWHHPTVTSMPCCVFIRGRRRRRARKTPPIVDGARVSLAWALGCGKSNARSAMKNNLNLAVRQDGRECSSQTSASSWKASYLGHEILHIGLG